MSRQHGSRVLRPHSDEWEEDWADVLGLGGINSGHNYELTEDEERELRKERRRAQQRRRPCGFAPWPENR